MKSFISVCAQYACWIITGWVLVLFLRTVETLLLEHHHFVFHLVKNELIGVGIDLVLISAFFAFLFPVFYLISRFSVKSANIFTGIILGVLVIAHIAIIQFFIQTSKPLGGMLIAHTFNEVIFTVRSAATNYFLFGTTIFAAIGLGIFIWILLKKNRFFMPVYYAVSFFSVLSVFFIFLINNYLKNVEQEAQPHSLYINKSYYFYHIIVSNLQKPYYCASEEMNLLGRKELFPEKHFVSDEYPFLAETEYNDVLGVFLNKTTDSQPPNIVFIIVEGLGSRFLPDFHGINLMPFLDSLSKESLFWEKSLTVGERSFSVIPALLASAPPARRGFIFENEIFSHSLINLLANQNYYSTYFYGQPKWFHNKENYFKRNKLNKLVDSQEFPERYSKIMVGDYFWGFHDQNLVKYALELIKDSLPEAPRLDIFFTGSMHAPFFIDNEAFYNKRLNDIIQQSSLEKKEKKYLQKYAKYLRTVLFTDDALRSLLAGYQQLPAYQNTIFIITGDHPMSEMPIENSYQRYRVPIILYSPLLKHSKLINSVNSHLDIAPTLLAFLHKNYQVHIPEHTAFIGKILDTTTVFRNNLPVIFMNGDRQIVDILFENYFLMNEKKLFKVHENDNIERVEDEVMQEKMLAMLQNFRKMNTYSCTYNKLIPSATYYQYSEQKIIYEFDDRSYSIQSEQEFGYPIIENLQFSGSGRYFFDVYSKDKNRLPKEVPLLVLELIDKETGEQIFWQSFQLDENQRFVHFTFEIEHEKELIIKSYFWNNKQLNANLLNTGARFYFALP